MHFTFNKFQRWCQLGDLSIHKRDRGLKLPIKFSSVFITVGVEVD